MAPRKKAINPVTIRPGKSYNNEPSYISLFRKLLLRHCLGPCPESKMYVESLLRAVQGAVMRQRAKLHAKKDNKGAWRYRGHTLADLELDFELCTKRDNPPREDICDFIGIDPDWFRRKATAIVVLYGIGDE